MATIKTSTDRSRFAGQPRARGNRHVSAQDLSAMPPGVGQLGDALQRAGSVGSRIATEIDVKQQQSAFNTEYSAYLERMGQEQNRIFQRTGRESFSAGKDVEEAQRVYGETALKNLDSSPMAKEMFERERLTFDRNSRLKADEFVVQQTNAVNNTAMEGKRGQYLNQIALNPTDNELFAGLVKSAKEDIEFQFQGQPDEFITLEQQKYASLAIEKRAEALAGDEKYGPAAAIAFINSGVEVDLEDETLKLKLGELRKKYQKAAIETEQKAAIDIGTKEAVTIVQAAYDAGDEVDPDVVMAQVYVAMMDRYGVDTAGKIMPNVERFQKYREAAQKSYDTKRESEEKRQKEEAEKQEKSQIDQEISSMVSGGAEAAENHYLSLVGNKGKKFADDVLAGYKSARGLSEDVEKSLKAKAEAAEKEREERRKRKEDADSSKASRAGRLLAKAESADLADIRDKLYANFPEKAAEMGIQAADAEMKGIQATRATAKVERELTLGAELKAAGNDATKMPSYGDLSPEEQKKYLDLGNALRAGTQAETKPNIRRYNELYRMSDDELLALWDKDLDQIIKDMGGINSKWFGSLQSRVDGYYQGERTATIKSRSEKAEAYKFIASELATIEREARQNLRSTGRSLSSEDTNHYLDSVLQYTDRRYDEEMRKAGVSKAEELDPTIRRQIQADAMLSVKSPGFFGRGSETITQAEIWTQGRSRETAGWAPVIGSYPPEVRDNYTGGKFIKEGNVPIEVNPPEDTVPGNVISTATALRGYVRRNLFSGAYEVIPGNRQESRVWFYADGSLFDPEKVAAPGTRTTDSAERSPFNNVEDYIYER